MSVSYDLSGISGLDPEGWNRHSHLGQDACIADRQAALQALEDKIAESQGRQARDVRPRDDLASREGLYSHDRNERTIYISQSDLESNDPFEAVNSVVHEGRHAYQNEVVENRDRFLSVSDSNKERWSHNLAPGNYISGSSSNFRAYYNQPVEIDARAFANLVEKKVCGPRPDTKPNNHFEKQPTPVTSDPGLDALKAELKASLKSDRPPPPPPPPPPSQGRGFTR